MPIIFVAIFWLTQDDFRCELPINMPKAFTWADGRKYIGQWEKGKKNGYGTLYDSNGNVIQQGWWKNDNFVKAQVPQAMGFEHY
jgi:hypothetical protein